MFPNIGSQSILNIAVASFNITALFAPSLSSHAEIFLRSDVNFTKEVTQRWTVHEAPSYTGAIKPATEADVKNIVSNDV